MIKFEELGENSKDLTKEAIMSSKFNENITKYYKFYSQIILPIKERNQIYIRRFGGRNRGIAES